jgi:hypothetical protein
VVGDDSLLPGKEKPIMKYHSSNVALRVTLEQPVSLSALSDFIPQREAQLPSFLIQKSTDRSPCKQQKLILQLPEIPVGFYRIPPTGRRD